MTRKPPDFSSDLGPRSLNTIVSAFLTKLAKHFALIACLMIIGKATGRFDVGQFGPFLMVVLAALLHSTGRALAPRFSIRLSSSKGPP